jgi:hypothetical protein
MQHIEGTDNNKLYRFHGEWYCEACHQASWNKSLTNDRTCPDCGSANLTPIWEPSGDAPKPNIAYQDIGDIVLTPEQRKDNTNGSRLRT